MNRLLPLSAEVKITPSWMWTAVERTNGTANAVKDLCRFQDKDGPELLWSLSPTKPCLYKLCQPTLLRPLTDALRTTRKLRETLKRETSSTTTVPWRLTPLTSHNHATLNVRASQRLAVELLTSINTQWTWMLIANAILFHHWTEEELIPIATANAKPLASRLTSKETETTTSTTQTETLKIESLNKLRKPSAISFPKLSTDAFQAHSTTASPGTHDRLQSIMVISFNDYFLLILFNPNYSLTSSILKL